MTLLDTLFGPIDSTKYCWYFYVLSVFGLVMLVLSGIGLILSMAGFSRRRRISMLPTVGITTGIIGYAMLYFTNRLLFQMCTSKGKCKGGKCNHSSCTKGTHMQEPMGSYEENRKKALGTLQQGVKQVQSTMNQQQAARVGRPVASPFKFA